MRILAVVAVVFCAVLIWVWALLTVGKRADALFKGDEYDDLGVGA